MASLHQQLSFIQNISQPLIFYGMVTIIPSFALSSVSFACFFRQCCKTFYITQSRHCGLCWRLGGWRSNTIPLKMVYRNLMNAQIPLIFAGTQDTRKTGQECINYICILNYCFCNNITILLWSDAKMLMIRQ